MFEQLFRFRGPLDAHLNAPLAEERRRFLCYRADEGLCRNSVRVLAYYLLACTQYLRLGDRPDELITYAEVKTQAVCWANRSSKSPNMRKIKGRRSSRGEFLRHACSWIKFMGRLQMPTAPAGPCAEQLATFANHLLRDKGLSTSGIAAASSGVSWVTSR